MLLRIVSVLLLLAGASATNGQERRKLEVVPATSHSNGVHSLAFSPDGRLLLSGGGDTTPRLWDVATGRLLRLFLGHAGHIITVAFSPDGRYAVSGSADETIKLWDIATGAAVLTLRGHSGGVGAVAFSRNGRLMLSGASTVLVSEDESKTDLLCLWDLARGRLLRKFIGQAWEVSAVDLSPDGRLALSGDTEGTIKVWDTGRGRVIRTLPGDLRSIQSVRFSPDARTALAVGDKTLKRWDVRTGQEIQSTALDGNVDADVYAGAFSNDARLVGIGTTTALRFIDTATGHELRALKGHASTVRSIAFSVDGRRAASGDDGNNIKVWEVPTGAGVRTIAGRDSKVHSVSFSPDNRFIVSASSENLLRVWASGALVRVFPDQQKALGFLPDNRTVVSVGVDGALNWYDVATGETVQVLRAPDGEKFDQISPDGRLAMSWRERGDLRLWDTGTGIVIQTLPGDIYGTPPLAIFSSDGRWLLRRGDRGESEHLNIWSLDAGREVRSIQTDSETLLTLALSRDGRLALSGGCDATSLKVCEPSALKLWDTVSGGLLHAFEGHPRSIRAAAFSADGKMAASGGSEGSVRVWDVATHRLIRALVGHTGAVHALAFSSDGARLVSGSNDGTMRVWALASGKETSVTLASSGRNWLTSVPASQITVPKIAGELNGEARAGIGHRARSEGSQSARFGSGGEDYR
jgi:WD40 repeat protein